MYNKVARAMRAWKSASIEDTGNPRSYHEEACQLPTRAARRGSPA